MWAARIFAVLAAFAGAAFAYVLAQPPSQPVAPQPLPTMVASAPAPSPTPPPAPRTPKPRATKPPRRTANPVASPAPPPPATNLSPAHQRVVQRLQRVFARPRVGGHVSAAVLDSNGRQLFSRAGASPVLPASTQKLAVAAAALARFGPDHRFTTTVTTSARPTARGVLRSDLVLVGGADPGLAQPIFAAIEPDRPRTPLERLVGQIKRRGVRRVAGRVIADPHILASEPIPAGWPGRYFDYLDATRITGLTIDAGRAVYRSGGSLQARAADDPARQTARVFRSLLRERGIKVTGTARVAPRQTSHPVTLASVSSQPLGPTLRYMVQRSDNHFADTIFRSLGAAAGDPTWVGSAQAVADTLAPLRLDWSGVVLADGSGLSRANRVSAVFLTQLHAAMWSSNLQQQWVQLLAVSGSSGTLRSRLTGTVAAGRLYGKTGSLRDVVSLVGTVVGSKGRLVHLAVVGNRLQSTSAVRELTDRAVLAIAEELQDCRRVRPPKRKRGKPRPVRLVCG